MITTLRSCVRFSRCRSINYQTRSITLDARVIRKAFRFNISQCRQLTGVAVRASGSRCVRENTSAIPGEKKIQGEFSASPGDAKLQRTFSFIPLIISRYNREISLKRLVTSPLCVTRALIASARAHALLNALSGRVEHELGRKTRDSVRLSGVANAEKK